MNRVEQVWHLADGWERLALVALIVATLAQSVFILVYGRRPWWRVRVGRALMIKSSTLGVLLWLSLLNAFVSYPHQEAVASIALCAVAAAILYQMAALLLSPRDMAVTPDRRVEADR